MIEVFADVVCPFTHVGLRRLVDERERRGRLDVRLRVRAWPLELVNGAPPKAALLSEEIAALRSQVVPDLFDAFDAATAPSSTMDALALGLAAYDLGDEVGERMALRLRAAFFEEGVAIGERAALEDVAREFNIDAAVLDDHDRVRADFDEGKRRGVVGSPHFFVGGDGFFCPGLDIRHDDTGFHVAVASDDFERFLGRCFS